MCVNLKLDCQTRQNLWRNRIPDCCRNRSRPTVFKFYSHKQNCEILIVGGGNYDDLEILNLKYLKIGQNEKDFVPKWTKLRHFRFPFGIRNCRKVISLNGMLKQSLLKHVNSEFSEAGNCL